MSWKDPLRHLSPLSEHPSASPSLSPAISDTSLSFLEASIRLDKLSDHSCGASRILRAFLDNLEQDGRQALAADIGICQHDDQRLIELANHLLDAILKPFKLAGGQAPAPLTTPPTLGAAQAVDLAMMTIEASTRADQTTLRSDCLRRDGHRCVYSGTWDFSSCRQQLVAPPPSARRGYTDCAHIIPFALGSFDDRDAVQTRNKAIIWFALHRYFPALCGKIDARSINQRANAMILGTGVHRFFGDYQLAFLPQGSNNYRTTQFFDGAMDSDSKSGSPLVQFTSTNGTIPMPDADFLRVHYIISQILQVSGFGDQISMAAEMAYLDLDCHALHPSGCTDVGALLSRMLLISVRADARDSTD